MAGRITHSFPSYYSFLFPWVRSFTDHNAYNRTMAHGLMDRVNDGLVSDRAQMVFRVLIPRNNRPDKGFSVDVIMN